MARIGAIAAMTRNRVIGLDNDIPWRYPEDWKRFKKITLNSSIIMGRKTWESIGSKPLPKRQNIIITRSKIEGVICTTSIEHGLELASEYKVWFIGGGQLYSQALQYCALIDVTWVPDQIEGDHAIYFPKINQNEWLEKPSVPLAADSRLQTQQFIRITRTKQPLLDKKHFRKS